MDSKEEEASEGERERGEGREEEEENIRSEKEKETVSEEKGKEEEVAEKESTHREREKEEEGSEKKEKEPSRSLPSVLSSSLSSSLSWLSSRYPSNSYEIIEEVVSPAPPSSSSSSSASLSKSYGGDKRSSFRFFSDSEHSNAWFLSRERPTSSSPYSSSIPRNAHSVPNDFHSADEIVLDLEPSEISFSTNPGFVGSEVGADLGIDDIIDDVAERESPRSFALSSPLLRSSTPSMQSQSNFLGFHRTDTYFPDDQYESVSESKRGQDLRDTFIHMEYRKVRRMTSGKYREDPRSWIWGIVYTIVMLTYLYYRFTTYDRACFQGYNYTYPWYQYPANIDLLKEVILVLVLGICFVSVTDNFQSLATTLTVFFLYLLVIFFFVLGDTNPCDTDTDNDPSHSLKLFFIWLGAVSVVWLFHFFYYYVTPFIVLHTSMCFGWKRLRSITIPTKNPRMSVTPESSRDSMIGSQDVLSRPNAEAGIKEVVFQYRPISIMGIFKRTKHTFLYRGEMKNGRPDGWGQWRDDSFHGESLAGFWRDGLPQGPFNSCEKGSGNIFSAVIIGYCSMRTTQWKCLPRDEYDGVLTFGVCSVECCISGDFYENFPELKLLNEINETCYCVLHGEPGKFCNKVSRLLPHMRHMEINQVTTSVVVSSTPEGELSITGHLPDLPENAYTATVFTREVDESSVAAKRTSMEIALAPDSLSPPPSPHSAYMGSSSSSSSVTASTQASGIRIENWHAQSSNEAIIFIHGYNIPLDWALKKFGQMLAGAGYPAFIKPFLFSWPTGKLFFYTKAVEMCKDDETVSAFTHFLSNLVQAGFKAVHILSHSMGIRLFLHAFSKPEVRDLFSNRLGESRSNQLQLASAIFCNPDYPLEQFKFHDYEVLRTYCSLITIYSDQGDTALKYSALFSGEMSLGRLGRPLLRPGGHGLLDVDVVDTTDLQNNMHAVRHSAFNINRIILEDMREVIVQRRRAIHRASRLVKKQGNFYVFMTIPSMVDGNVV